MPENGREPMIGNSGRGRWLLFWQAMLVVLVAGLVYWPLLGSSGFAFSEGQRALPGWEMVHNGDWLVPRLFEQPYLRKPPGMPWAVALMSLIFGENEFSARSVSALSMTLASLLSFWFATRWFGRPWGLVAGIAHVLTPLFWFSPTSPVGRSAEIEALHNLFVQASVLVMIEVLVARPRDSSALRWSFALAIAASGMALVKGPAGVPCLAGAAAGACIAAKSLRPLRSGWTWMGLLIAAGLVALVALRIVLRVHDLPEPPVTEPPGRFLWRPGEALGVVSLPIVTLIAAMPTSLSLLLTFRDARIETREDKFARAVAWACVAALLIYAVIGVSNNRYAMPAVGVLPCLWAFVLRRHFERLPSSRPLLDQVLMNRPWAWGVAFLLAAFASIVYTEHRRAERTSGKPAGLALGEQLDDGQQVWANAVMDNRPEVLYYARQRATELGRQVRVLWVPPNHGGQSDLPIPPSGRLLALLEGPDLTELPAYDNAGLLSGMHEVFSGQVHKFVIHVYEVR
jgi:4-amino-4-deoxy-L-arabinose transferase-like glycosyltransferase